MSVSQFSDLVSEILQDCQQAPEPMVERAIRDAVIELADYSKALQRTLDAITIEAEQPRYSLLIPDGYRFIHVVKAQIEDDTPLVQASENQLDLWWDEPTSGPLQFDRWSQIDTSNGSSWRQFAQDRPMAFYIERSDNAVTMRLVGIPTSQIVDSLVAKIAVKPSREATEVDEWFLEDHYEKIKNGARSRMLLVPRRPWTDGEMGMLYRGMFDEDKEELRKQVARSHIRDDEQNGHVKAWI